MPLDRDDRATIEIAELVLRLPGVDKADAPALAEEILAAAAERLRGTGRTGRLQLAELRVKLPAGTRRADLIDQVADRIVEVLR
jgi:hypothetical protein